MKAMKRSIFIILLFSTISFFLTLISCDLFPTSIPARIDALEIDLNGTGERGVVDNFHPDMIARSTWNADDQFDVTPLREDWKDYTITMSGSPAPSGNRMTQSGTIVSTSPVNPVPSRTIIMHFKEDGTNNWKIIYIWLTGGYEWGDAALP